MKYVCNDEIVNLNFCLNSLFQVVMTTAVVLKFLLAVLKIEPQCGIGLLLFVFEILNTKDRTVGTNN